MKLFRFEIDEYAGCSGIIYDSNKKPKEEICHKKKGSTLVTLDLMNPEHIALITYNLDYTVSSSEPLIDHELNDIYTLNHEYLISNRSNSLDDIEYQIFDWQDEFDLSKKEAYRKGISLVESSIVEHKEAVLTILRSRIAQFSIHPSP